MKTSHAAPVYRRRRFRRQLLKGHLDVSIDHPLKLETSSKPYFVLFCVFVSSVGPDLLPWTQEAFVKHVVSHVMNFCGPDLDFFNQFYDKSLLERLQRIKDKPFVRVSQPPGRVVGAGLFLRSFVDDFFLRNFFGISVILKICMPTRPSTTAVEKHGVRELYWLRWAWREHLHFPWLWPYFSLRGIFAG